MQVQTEELQARRNALSKQIGALKSRGEDTTAVMAEAAAIPDQVKGCETQLANIQSRLTELLLGVPNPPHASVPAGRSPEDNVEIRRWGEPMSFDFAVRDHVDLGAGLGLDFDTAAKLSGSRFTLMRGPVARLHRALAQLMLDVQTAESNANAVNVIGTLRSRQLRAETEKANAAVALDLRFRYDNNISNLMRRSDHWPFLNRGVPGLWFHTGLHPDYHTDGDRPERINYVKMEKVARLVYQMSWNLAEQAGRPALDPRR